MATASASASASAPVPDSAPDSAPKCFACGADAGYKHELPFRYKLFHTLAVYSCIEHFLSAKTKVTKGMMYAIPGRFLIQRGLSKRVFTVPNLKGVTVEGTIELDSISFKAKNKGESSVFRVIVLIGTDGNSHIVKLSDIVGDGLELNRICGNGTIVVGFDRLCEILYAETIAYYGTIQPEDISI